MPDFEDSFECRYEVDDGYVGKARPVRFHVPADDIYPEMDESDLRQMFDEMMQDHFEMNICPYAVNEDDFVEWGLEVIENMKNNPEDTL